MKVEVRDLVRVFGTLRALDGITLEVPEGAVLAVLGTNGAGKTTFLRLLAGLLSPTSGEILYDGELFTRARLDLRKRLMFVADGPLLLQDTTVIGYIGACLRLYGVEKQGVEQQVLRILRDLDTVNLAGMPFATLSRGQSYKTALASLAAVDPELWLLDEPFASGMDPTGLAFVARAMRAAAARGHTIVFGTQLLALAEKVADRAVILGEGRVIAAGALQELTTGGKGLEEVFMHYSGCVADGSEAREPPGP